MKKSQATNTFNEGMIMDLNPIVTPNNVLTNCLNGTLVTFNGNENVLQNDMGNGRVETAYLPEGYMPLGTAELGGVIYIVSYNPLKGLCQIGSFPSPERNITEDSDLDLKVSLVNSDFDWKGANKGANTYYVKKELNKNLTFNPGDKFIIYSGQVVSNYPKFWRKDAYYTDEWVETTKNHTVKISLGAITDTGEFINFSSLKEYRNTASNKDHPYFILQSDSEIAGKEDLDDYRSLITQPYNVYQSKISGRLILIAELVAPSSFSVSISNNITKPDRHKEYIPSATLEFKGDYEYIPIGVHIEGSLKGKKYEGSGSWEIELDVDKEEGRTEYTRIDNDIIKINTQSNLIAKLISDMIEDGYFDSETRDSEVLTLEFTPQMTWGLVKNLTQTIVIDLSKIGTGTINLTQWRYFNEDKICTLNWGLEIYEQENWYVKGVNFTFIRVIDSSGNTDDTTVYTVPFQKSYFGFFTEKFSKSEFLVPNTVYLVKIIVDYQSEDGMNKDTREIYRYLYTNNVFNNYYYNTNDFQNLTIELTPNINTQVSTAFNKTKGVIEYGNDKVTTAGKTEEEIEEMCKSINSLSAIENTINIESNIQTYLNLVEDFNTFQLKYSKDFATFEWGTNNLTLIASNTTKYTDEGDSNQKDYLSVSCMENTEAYNFTITEFSYNSGSYRAFIDSNIYEGTFYYKDNLLYLRGLPLNIHLNSSEYKYNKETDFTITIQEGTLELYGFTNVEDNSRLSILNHPSYVVKDVESNSDTFYNNTWYNKISGTIEEYIKAYSLLDTASCTYNGKFIPILSINDLPNNNIQVIDSKFYPTRFVSFGSCEDGGSPGVARVGVFNLSNTRTITGEMQEYSKTDNVNVEFMHSSMQEKISGAGASGKFMLIVHQNIGNNGQMVIYKNGIGKYLSHGARSVRPFKIFLGIFSDDGGLYPVQMLATINYKTSELADIFDAKDTEFTEFFQALVKTLNNVYYYDSSAEAAIFIVPTNVLFVDSSKLNITIPYTCSIDIEKEHDFVFQDSGATLTTIKTAFKDTGVNMSNLEIKLQNISSETYTIPISWSNTSDGKTLRNHFINDQSTSLNACVLDYDGSTILGTSEVNGNVEKIYTRNDKDIILAQSFIPNELNYQFDGDVVTSVTPTGTKMYSITKTDLTKILEIKNGRLSINSPTRGWSCTRGDNNSSSDTGTYSGFQELKIITGKYDNYELPITS